MGILWSICIPTYNRAAYLKRNLDCLLREINEQNSSLIEVLVSDNASTDDTEDVVRAVIQRGLKVAYIRNVENIGSDANFLQCVQCASGKYVLLLGDDDILLPGAVSALVQILQEDEYGVVYLTSTGVELEDKDIPQVDVHHVCKEVYTDANDFLHRVSFIITFMSGNIFNKRLLNQQINYADFCGSNFVQVPLYITAALNAKKNVFLSQFFVGVTEENGGGYGIFDVFGRKFNEILRKMIPYGLSEVTIQKINNELLRRHFSYLMVANKKQKTYVPEKIDALKQMYGKNWRFWVFDYPVYWLPYPLAAGYYFCERVVNKLIKVFLHHL